MTAGFVRQAVGRAIPAAALGDARAEATRSGIAEVGRMLLGLPEAVRVKVFDGEGTVLWSDEPRLIGSNFGRDRRVQQSLTGHRDPLRRPRWRRPVHGRAITAAGRTPRALRRWPRRSPMPISSSTGRRVRSLPFFPDATMGGL